MWTLRTSADGFPFVEEIIDVSATLVMEPENWPQGLHLPLSLMRLSFSLQDTNPWILLTRYKWSQTLEWLKSDGHCEYFQSSILFDAMKSYLGSIVKTMGLIWSPFEFQNASRVYSSL